MIVLTTIESWLDHEFSLKSNLNLVGYFKMPLKIYSFVLVDYLNLNHLSQSFDLFVYVWAFLSGRATAFNRALKARLTSYGRIV